MAQIIKNVKINDSAKSAIIEILNNKIATHSETIATTESGKILRKFEKIYLFLSPFLKFIKISKNG